MHDEGVQFATQLNEHRAIWWFGHFHIDYAQIVPVHATQCTTDLFDRILGGEMGLNSEQVSKHEWQGKVLMNPRCACVCVGGVETLWQLAFHG